MSKWIKVVVVLLVVLIAVMPVGTVSMDKTTTSAAAYNSNDEATGATRSSVTTLGETGTVISETETSESGEDEIEDIGPDMTVVPEAGPTPDHNIEIPSCIPLSNGMKDEDGSTEIKDIQQRLIDLNYLTGEADGYYGKQSYEAVCAFQVAHSMDETGVVDVDTYCMLMSMYAIKQPEPTVAPVHYGSSGDDVKMVQERLITWGFLIGTADGDYGESTEKAIEMFKTYCNKLGYTTSVAHLPELLAEGETLAPTEAPTPEPTAEPTEAPAVETAAGSGEVAVIEIPTEEPTPSPEPTPTAFKATGDLDAGTLEYFEEGNKFKVYNQDVQDGDKNTDVQRVQNRLVTLGYLYEPHADGEYGDVSKLALAYFQKKSGLKQTGVADEATQEALFSEDAPTAEEYVFSYKVLVDVSDQRVYVFQWTGDGYSSEPCKTFVCSTGTQENPTPYGTFQARGRTGEGEWHYFEEFHCYAKWAFRIYGGILFHSVTFSSMNDSTISKYSLKRLGKPASHGCVRLTVEDAYWIYNNLPNGVTVVIQK